MRAFAAHAMPGHVGLIPSGQRAMAALASVRHLCIIFTGMFSCLEADPGSVKWSAVISDLLAAAETQGHAAHQATARWHRRCSQTLPSHR